MSALLKELRRLARGEVLEQQPLAPRTSVRVGGAAKLWVRPRDPVTLGLCSLKDLNDAVDKARRKAAREDAAKKKAAAKVAAPEEPAPAEESVDPAEADQRDLGQTRHE